MAYINPFTGGLLPGSTAPGIAISGTVNTFAELPAASSSNNGQYFIVNTTTATLGLFNKKLAGTYLSNGATWNYVGALTLSSISDVNISSPAAGHVLSYDSINGGWVNSASGSGLTNPMTTAGDLIIGGTGGAPQRLAAINGLVKGYGTTYQAAIAGTDYQDPLLVAEIIVGSGISSGKTLYVGSGSAVTEIVFSSLDGNAAGGYDLRYIAKSASGNPNLSIYINGDTTEANYYQQIIYNSAATTVAAANQNVATVGYIPSTSDSVVQELNITRDLNGNTRYTSIAGRGTTTTLQAKVLSGYNTTVISNITSIAMTANIANSIAVGSVFRLYKRK